MRAMLKTRLWEAGMTQKELSEAIGVSQSTVWRWCRWRWMKDMSVGRLVEVAEALGCDPEELFDHGQEA